MVLKFRWSLVRSSYTWNYAEREVFEWRWSLILAVAYQQFHWAHSFTEWQHWWCILSNAMYVLLHSCAFRPWMRSSATASCHQIPCSTWWLLCVTSSTSHASATTAGRLVQWNPSCKTTLKVQQEWFWEKGGLGQLAVIYAEALRTRFLKRGSWRGMVSHWHLRKWTVSHRGLHEGWSVVGILKRDGLIGILNERWFLVKVLKRDGLSQRS